MAGVLPSRSFALTAAVLLAFGLSGCMSNRMTYGTGVTPGRQTMKDLSGLITLGGGDEKPAIDYNPRPPIVAPPATASLPPPAGDGAASAPTGDWPRDPDEAIRLSKKNNPDGDPSVIRLLPVSAAPTATKSAAEEDPHYFNRAESARKKKLIAEAKGAMEGGRDAEGNLIRKTLIEPPVEYREPDPTAPTEFDPKKKKRKWKWPWQPG